jgi:hypothetical protein
MGLIVIRIVTMTMRANIEGFHMVTVNYASNRFVSIVFSVSLHTFLSIIAPKSRIR